MKRMTTPEHHQHLQVRQETVALKRATENGIDQGYHLLLPNHGKHQEGTSSSRSLQKNKNRNRSPELLPPEGEQRRIKLLNA